MDWFLIQPLFVLALTQVLLLFILTVYLLSLKNKTRGTWLLANALGFLGLLWMQQLLSKSLYGELPFNLDPIDEICVPITVWSLLAFSYSFLFNPFQKEARWVVTGAGLLVGGNALYHLTRVFGFEPFPLRGALLVESGSLILVVIILSVYLRKRSYINRNDEPGEQKQKKLRALNAFSLLTLGILMLNIRGVWVIVSSMWPGLGTPSPFISFLNLPLFVFLLIGLVIVYINHMPEPTSIQAKIIGLSLVTLLAVLGLLDPVLFNKAKFQQEALSLLPNQQTLRFVPDDNGGYQVGYAPFHFDTDLGDNLQLGPETDTLVAMDFAFPFSGGKWDELYVDSNGLVSFGGRYTSRQFDDFYQTDLPKIAPYYRSLVPLRMENSGVFYKREDQKVTVTWLNVWESLNEAWTNRNTVQLVLHDSGIIEFVYDKTEAPFDGFSDGLRGLRPGGPEVPWETMNYTALPEEFATKGLLFRQKAVRFEPGGQGEYDLLEVPFEFDTALGDKLSLGDDTNERVSLDFSFPFYEEQWTDVFVSANGAVSFGGPINPSDSIYYRPLRDFFDGRPKIAPLFVDLNPAQGGGVYYKSEEEKLTVTWSEVPFLNTPFTNNVQLVLHQQGAIDFVYDWIGGPLYGSEFWGVYAGDDRPRNVASDFQFMENARPLTAGTASIELFNLRYRELVHAKMAPLAYAVVLSVLFVLGVFPLFFRASVIKPLASLLRGVKQIDEGDLEAKVPVRVNDEIGILAENFNRMTSSLKEAEAQLRTYAEGLEDKVAERTADLEKALSHLTETQDQLIHAEKMAALGSLTAGIAHELKNPLNFVNNFSEMSMEFVDELMEELKNAEQGDVLTAVKQLLPDLKHNAEKIREHGMRADGIVRSMLEHSKSSTGRREVFDVNALVMQYVELAQHGMTQKEGTAPSIKVELGESVSEIEGVPKEIGRVLLNLLNNAAYTVQEKSSGQNDAYSPCISISTHDVGENIEIRVIDNGNGIPENLLDQIFEPFFTTKPTGTGTGLGLSLSHDIITRGHNGKLEVQSVEGEGATFVIRLPQGAGWDPLCL